MMAIERITSSQFRMLVLYSTCSTSILSMPLILGSMAGRDSWWIVLLGTLLGAPIVFMLLTLARWYPKSTFFQISQAIVGKKLGLLCAIAFTLLPLLTVSTKLHYSTAFITTHLLVSTPTAIIVGLCMTVVAMACLLGIESFGRTAELTTFFFFIPLTLLFVMKWPEAEFGTLLPFYRGETTDYVNALFFYISITACNSIILLSIYPRNVSNKKKAERAFWEGFLIACSILFLVTLLCITVLGPELMIASYFPMFTLSQRVSFGDFAQRVEALLTIIWFITIFFKITLYLYATVRGFNYIFTIKKTKTLVLPIALLFLFIPLQAFDDSAMDYEFYVGPAMWLSLLIGGLLPIGLFTIGLIKRKKRKQAIFPKHSVENN